MSTEQRGITIVTYLANRITPIDVLSTTNFKLGNNVPKSYKISLPETSNTKTALRLDL